jgi:hypothetical protein
MGANSGRAPEGFFRNCDSRGTCRTRGVNDPQVHSDSHDRLARFTQYLTEIARASALLKSYAGVGNDAAHDVQEYKFDRGAIAHFQREKFSLVSEKREDSSLDFGDPFIVAID